MTASTVYGEPMPLALITGSAGFIGFHLARRLLDEGWRVVGVDGFTPYYDLQLKEDRDAILCRSNHFSGHRFMLEDGDRIGTLIEETRPQVVVHLAAQAGVRYSLENPRAYIDSNIVGTFNLLEACRATPPRHLLMASTSSVYGAGTEIPFQERAETDHPLSIYAATKKATEELAHSYAHLFRFPVTMFRFFTVYGPWGRPDMALFKFTRAILEGQPIDVYGHGKMTRDFTFIDDLVTAIVALTACIPVAGQPVVPADTVSPDAPFRVVNIGASQPVGLEDFITAVEDAVGQPAERNYLEMQSGDVPVTYADVSQLRALTGRAEAATPVGAGVQAFVDWYRAHYQV